MRNLVDEPLKFHEIISNERLEAMMTDCRFYMVKSSNEDNVQKARECSVWATTFLNQVMIKALRISSKMPFNAISTCSSSSGPTDPTS